MKKRTFIFSLITSLTMMTTYAQDPYFIDSTFGINGVQKVSNPLFGPSPFKVNRMTNMKIASNNNIVIGGNTGFSSGVSSDWSLSRLKPNGQLDSTFNSTGHLKFSGSNQPDSKDFTDLVVLPNNKIIYAGKSTTAGGSNILVYKINVNGTFDQTFGQNGVTRFSTGTLGFNSLYAMAAQNDDKLILLTNNFNNSAPSVGSIVRLNSNGSLDNTFGTGGILSSNVGFANNNILYSMIKVLADNSILVTGTHITSGPQDYIRVDFVAKFSADGILQTTFGNNGKVILPKSATERLFFLNQDIEVDNNGFIYVNCSTNGPVTPNVLVYKLSATGSLVNNYGQNGRLVIEDLHNDNWYFYDACIQDNNKLLVTAMMDTGLNAEYQLKRINEDGTDDLTFDGLTSEIIGTRNAYDHFHYLGLQDNDKIILGGYGRSAKNESDSIFPIIMRFVDTVQHGGTDTSGGGTSLLDIKDQNVIKLFPNPIQNQFTLEGTNSITDIVVQDISGRTIFSDKNQGKLTRTIDCSKWLPGTYVIYLKEKERNVILTHKIVKH